MKDLKYKIAFVAYYGSLTVAAILVLYSLVSNTSRLIQLNMEIQSLQQQVNMEIQSLQQQVK
jgi:cell division protein FtsL